MSNLSVITVNYNNAEGLETTFKSVISQSLLPFEYIVIDGGSTDKSLEIIRKYELYLAYWVSEKDSGVYEAMNKGIKAAQGDYVLFLNSGDALANEKTLEKIKLSGEDIVYGDLLLSHDDGTTVLKQYPEKLTFDYFFQHDSLPHPASFIKRSLFYKVGLYNEELKIVSDWEFWLKAIFLHQASYRRIPLLVSIFGLDGISSKEENAARINSEKNIVYQTNFPGIIGDYHNFQTLRTDKRVIILKQLERYPFLSKIATAALIFLSWVAGKIPRQQVDKRSENF